MDSQGQPFGGEAVAEVEAGAAEEALVAEEVSEALVAAVLAAVAPEAIGNANSYI